jgi:transcription termination factor Rho
MVYTKNTSSTSATVDNRKSQSIDDIIGKPRTHDLTVGALGNDEQGTVVRGKPSVTGAEVVPQPRYLQQTTVTQEVSGILDIQPEGHGFLRPKFIPSSRDIYISQSQIRRFLLRPGDLIAGVGRPPKDTERYFGLLKVEKVNNIAADDSLKKTFF